MARRIVAIAYPDAERAHEALEAVEELHPIDAVVVVRESDGRLTLHQRRQMSAGEGAIAGGTAGLLAGLFFGVPIGAALLGLAAGTGAGIRDTGIADDSLRLLAQGLGDHEALVCVLVDEDSAPAAVDGLARYGGAIVDAEVPLP